ncbi:hypothetical protein TW74_09535 [Vibrio nigripulchritudo]|nr:hypothetical protein TW74_09535 [Vibrio nigripulchritudo]
MFTIWISTCAVIIALFEMMQKSSTTQSNELLASWLSSNFVKNGKSNSWRTLIAEIFDNLYSSRFFSFKFISRSIITTLIISFTIVFSLDIFLDFFGGIENEIYGIFFLALTVSLITLIPDYFSLIETRMVIWSMLRYPSKLSIMFFFLFDLFLTSSIIIGFHVFFWLFVFITDISIDTHFLMKEHVFQIKTEYQTVVTVSVLLGIVSTYSSCIWIVLFSISGFAYRFLNFIGAPISFIYGSVIDVEKYPFRALCFLCVGLVSITFAIISFII